MEQTLGHYKIVSELGRGGMGVVYKAYEESLNRYVAIKVLGEHLGHDDNFVKRFVREAKAAAGLSHPNVIQIFFIGQEPAPGASPAGSGTRHYFVMEHVEGRSVHDLLEAEGAIEPRRAARIVLQAAAGLAAAHDQGLVHRDIKPANLLVTKEERVKIADFGLALSPADGTTRLTATHSLMGTPGYLSPEQCCGEPAGPRSDIYSLGMTFYEMLTGTMPFKGESPLAVLRQILDEDPPPLLEVDPDLDPRIARVVERMVAKEPNDRYQSCHELVADLQEVVGTAGGAPDRATAGAPRPVALPPLPLAASRPTSARTLARLSGRPEDAPTQAAPRPASAAPAAAPPPVAAAPVGHPAASPRAASSSSGRRWVVIAAMAFLLVAAVSGAGLLLGWPALIGGENEEPAEASELVAETKGVGSSLVATDGSAVSDPGAGSSPRSDAVAGASASLADTGGAESENDRAALDQDPGASESANERDGSSVAPVASVGAAVPAARPLARSAAAPGGGQPVPSSAVRGARRLEVRASPRVAVIAIGEPMLAGAAEEALESQLARHSLDLYDERGILELRDSGGAASFAPSQLLEIVAERGVDVLILIDVEALGERELRALGRYSYATSSRVRLDAFLAAEGDGIGRGWSEQVEYTEANATRQADGAMGRVSTEMAEAIAAAWDDYRARAAR